MDVTPLSLEMFRPQPGLDLRLYSLQGHGPRKKVPGGPALIQQGGSCW